MRLVFLVILGLFLPSVCFSYDVDLQKGLFYGRAFGSDIRYIEAKFGKPAENSKTYSTYYTQYGFQVGKDGNKAGEYSFYFLNDGDSRQGKVPEGNVAFKGTFSYGIRPGATLETVHKQVAKSGKQYVLYKGNWCIGHSSSCKEPGYLLLVRINRSYHSELVFDENALIVSASVYEDNEDSDYFSRINLQSIKDGMYILDHR